MKDVKFDKELVHSFVTLPNNCDILFGNTCNHASKQLCADVWHIRMRHIPDSKLKHLSLNIDFGTNAPYEICSKAKQHRLPFPLSSTSTSFLFELIHVDTWGPYHTKTHAGHGFFLTVVDDYTRATWTHLMVTKVKAMGLIKSFVKMVQTQFSAKIKILRSDNALELSTSHTALEFFATNGILHQTS